jgi:hypothetical protein
MPSSMMKRARISDPPIRQLRAPFASRIRPPGDFPRRRAGRCRFREIPEHEGRRYYLNQWVDAPERWIQTAEWERCKKRSREPDDEAEIVLALEGNSTRESVARRRHDRGDAAHLRRADLAEERADEEGARRRDRGRDPAGLRAVDVRLIGANPNRWPQTIETLQEELGDDVMVEYDSHKPALMVVAARSSTTPSPPTARRLSDHDGNEILSAHSATRS